MATIRLKQSPRQIERMILQEVRYGISNRWAKALPQFVVGVRRILRHELTSGVDYANLTDQGSELKGLLGLGDDASQRLDEIITHWLDGIDCRMIPIRATSQGLSGGIRLTAIKSSFTDVIHLPAASYTTENGFNIPFLEWALLAGSKPLVRGWYASDRIGLAEQVSRSGTHLMREKTGSVFVIPAQYAGDKKTGNWATHAVDRAIPLITSLIERTFTL